MRKACVVKEKACSSGSDANPLLLTSPPPPPPHQFTYTPGWSLERHSECPVQKHNKMSLARMQFRPVDWVLNHYGNTALQVSDMVFHNSSCFFFPFSLFCSGKTSSEVDGAWGIDWQSLHHPKWRVSLGRCAEGFRINLPILFPFKLFSPVLDILIPTSDAWGSCP